MAELDVYDDVSVRDLAARSGAAHIHAFQVVESTMDVAHDEARAGAPHGCVILAETQRAGRGRGRREWRSPRGGVWLTVILRDVRSADLALLPLRIGIAAAKALDDLAGRRVGLKWPNDLVLDGGKLGGVLVEARWRGDQLDWVAAGVGINTGIPEGVNAAALEGTRPASVAERAIRSVLDASARCGELSEAELAEFRSRDILRGSWISAPTDGVVVGITSFGELLVDRGGVLVQARSGSVVSAVRPQSVSANS